MVPAEDYLREYKRKGGYRMRIQKVLEGMIPAVFFVYLIGVYTLGGVALLASTLPFFTIFFAIFGSIVFSQASVQKDDNSRAKNRKQG